jgi:N-acetylglucosaminyldiphosphoundecaprenol N-acetyl-beta-D-mannosaminyltransferase
MPTSIDELETLSVMGLPVHWSRHYVDWLLLRHRQGLGAHVVTLNAEMAMQADSTPALREVIHQAELVIPDGAGIVLYFRLKGRHIQRYPGIELAEELLQKLSNNESVFFLGAAPGIAEKAAAKWRQHHSVRTIAGTQDGYFSPEAEAAILHRLEQLQPSVILVALGVPRQEYWIRDQRSRCPQAIWIGVGGSFDIWAGTKERAPAWFCKNNLEWLYRLYQEPWRWRRMLALPKFAVRALTYSTPR